MTNLGDQHSSVEPVPFRQAFAHAASARDRVHLLTGNGASIALVPSFRDKELTRKLLDQDRSLQLLSNLALNDAEDVESILRVLEPDEWEMLRDPITGGVAYPDTFFANLIASVHPESYGKTCRQALASARAFFRRFSSISTTNYDLLLHWALMDAQQASGLIDHFDDGFRASTNTNWLIFGGEAVTAAATVRYLHGALHLSFANRNTVRYENLPQESTPAKLAELHAADGRRALIVSGGTSDAKTSAIERYEYLRLAYGSFKQISGALFVHGFGFNEADHHIVDAIGKNRKLSHLYVGIFSEAPESERDAVTQAAVRLRDKRASTANPLSVTLYQSETAPIWNPGLSVATAELKEPTCDRCPAAGCVLDAHALR